MIGSALRDSAEDVIGLLGHLSPLATRFEEENMFHTMLIYSMSTFFPLLLLRSDGVGLRNAPTPH